MQKIITLLVIVFLSGSAYPENQSETFMPAHQKATVVYVNKDNRNYRSQVSVVLKKISDKPTQTYQLEKKGKGAYGKYEEVSWLQNALMEEKNGQLYTKQSSCILKNKDQEIIFRYSKDYDYQNGKIYWRKLNGQGKLIKKVNFPIKGKTCDDITLPFFLKKYVANLGDKNYRYYYFLSNEPKLYKTIIFPKGEEELDLEIGKINAIKIQLRGDMGIVDDLLDKFVPQTFVWYSKNPPYIFLKYQGLETGFPSDHVTATVTEHSFFQNKEKN